MYHTISFYIANYFIRVDMNGTMDYSGLCITLHCGQARIYCKQNVQLLTALEEEMMQPLRQN
jgi:hypothetical protein